MLNQVSLIGRLTHDPEIEVYSRQWGGGDNIYDCRGSSLCQPTGSEGSRFYQDCCLAQAG